MFFNRVWEKKRESENAYAEHMKLFSDQFPRKKHDPLPEVPPSPTGSNPKVNRNRSLSARHYESPTLITREIHSSSSSLTARPSPYVVEDDGLSPYAVVKRTSYPQGKEYRVHKVSFLSNRTIAINENAMNPED